MGLKALGDPLSCLADSKVALTKAIVEAARFSLISRNPQSQNLDHPSFGSGSV